jgi:hypothetical protein
MQGPCRPIELALEGRLELMASNSAQVRETFDLRRYSQPDICAFSSHYPSKIVLCFLESLCIIYRDIERIILLT